MTHTVFYDVSAHCAAYNPCRTVAGVSICNCSAEQTILNCTFACVRNTTKVGSAANRTENIQVSHFSVRCDAVHQASLSGKTDNAVSVSV